MLRCLAVTMRRTAGLLAGLAVVAVGAYGVTMATGKRPLVVYSGSMEPMVDVGSLAFVDLVPSERVRVGDVITFNDPRQPNRLITHRVVARFPKNGTVAYRTKGDANRAVDPWTIALPAHVGRLSFSVPYAGYALTYVQTRELRTGFVLVFSLLVLTSLLRRIWRPEPKRVGATG